LREARKLSALRATREESRCGPPVQLAPSGIMATLAPNSGKHEDDDRPAPRTSADVSANEGATDPVRRPAPRPDSVKSGSEPIQSVSELAERGAGGRAEPPREVSSPTRVRATRIRRIWNLVSHHPLWATVVGGLLCLAIWAAASTAWHSLTRDELEPSTNWFPVRTNYRCFAPENCLGSDHVTLNSTINNAVAGDERAFLAATHRGSRRSVKDRLDVEVGDVITLRAFVANNADPGLLPPGQDVAVGTRLRVVLPTDSAEQHLIVALLSAENAKPPLVGDGVLLRAGQPSIEPVPGSARLINRRHSDGLTLPNTIFTDGSLLGYERLDGRLPSSYSAAGWVTLDVVVRAS
jgi:hypothetical protein